MAHGPSTPSLNPDVRTTTPPPTELTNEINVAETEEICEGPENKKPRQGTRLLASYPGPIFSAGAGRAPAPVPPLFRNQSPTNLSPRQKSSPLCGQRLSDIIMNIPPILRASCLTDAADSLEWRWTIFSKDVITYERTQPLPQSAYLFRTLLWNLDLALCMLLMTLHRANIPSRSGKRHRMVSISLEYLTKSLLMTRR